MRLYLDAMVWIYALEGRSAFSPAAQNFLRAIKDGRHTILASHFLLAEILVVPLRESDAFSIAAYKRAFLAADAVSLVPFDAAVAMNFATLRASTRVKSPDAIHLALAATARADAFITTDGRLTKLTIPGIGLIGDLSPPLN
jgi:predicted nucleic acid-binding protein